MESNDNATRPESSHWTDMAPVRSLTPLSYLSAPVPDYASSLLSHRADLANDANTAFLRESLDSISTAAPTNRSTTVDQSRDPRLGFSPRRQRNVSLNRSTSPTSRDRLQRYLSHLYRTHNPPASTAAAYSNRTPSPHRQSIYDWAPEGNAEQSQPEPMQQEQDDTHALPNATSRMLRYFMDRERSGLSEEEERARNTGWYRTSNTSQIQDWTSDNHAFTRSRQSRVAQFRRDFLSGHMPSTQSTHSTGPPRRSVLMMPSLLESAVKYLDGLKHCQSYNDALDAAIDLDLATKDLYASKHDEFILDIEELERPAYSSWLQPGTVFHGHQYATSMTTLARSREIVRSAPRPEQINPHYRPSDHAPYVDASRHSSITALPKISTDSWPVHMTIHAVDYDTMTLQGTMEAYDVPRPASILSSSTCTKSGKKDAPITTYVEGHIVDFINHSFLTPSTAPFKGRRTESIFPAATPSRDAENWHRLPPFNDNTADDMAKLLLSRDRLRALNNDYIFMRWKERCFVHSKNDKCSDQDRHNDHDRGHGLTISGFYYISLRRSDGMVEGIYYDPHSTPYQHLKLNITRSTWPAWQAR